MELFLLCRKFLLVLLCSIITLNNDINLFNTNNDNTKNNNNNKNHKTKINLFVNAKDYETIAKLKVKGIADWFTDEEKKIMKNKRIRREVRDLTDDEWNDITNAMNIMKYTDTITGKSLYGDNYISYDELVCWHTMTAFSYNGDYGHGLPHFGMWHRGFMLLFENSLLSINSNINAFPYWDYRLDALNPKESEFFGDKYIGNLMGDENNGYAILNGPFAYWPVALASEVGCDDYGNVFGLMRERVNPNGNKYVTRIGESFCLTEKNTVGDIEDWETCLDETDFVDFVECYEGSVHGGTHLGVGGTTERYIGKENENNIDYSNINYGSHTWCHTWLNGASITQNGKKINRFWAHERNNCFVCPSCNLDEIGDDIEAMANCVCTLRDDFEENGCVLDNPDGYLNDTYSTNSLNSHLIEHIWGDMLDAISSVNDPIFFFHHFNMDHYTYLWQIERWDLKPYYGYPENGWEYGNNLNDISSPERPFKGTLFHESYNNGEFDGEQEMTIKNIFDGTSFVNAPYIYDDIYAALFEDDSDYAEYMKHFTSSNSNDDEETSSGGVSSNSKNNKHNKNSNNNNHKNIAKQTDTDTDTDTDDDDEDETETLSNDSDTDSDTDTDSDSNSNEMMLAIKNKIGGNINYDKISENMNVLIIFGFSFALFSCLLIMTMLQRKEQAMAKKRKLADSHYGSIDSISIN